MDPLFLVAAGAMVVAAMAFVLLALRRRSGASTSRAALNSALLAQRLSELERERDCGQLGAQEFEAAREELQRRALLEVVADDPAGGVRRSRTPLLLAAIALPVVAVPLYLVFGSPHLSGTGREERGVMAEVAGAGAGTASAVAGSAPLAMLAQLEAHVLASPDDGRAWVMLARARMNASQFEPAAVAYERALAVAPKVARDPMIWCELADALGMSQGGSLAGRPRELIGKALELSPNAPCALEMAGSYAVEVRDFRSAQEYWGRLLKMLPPGSTQHQQLQAALERIEPKARFSLSRP